MIEGKVEIAGVELRVLDTGELAIITPDREGFSEFLTESTVRALGALHYIAQTHLNQQRAQEASRGREPAPAG